MEYLQSTEFKMGNCLHSRGKKSHIDRLITMRIHSNSFIGKGRGKGMFRTQERLTNEGENRREVAMARV